MIRRLILIVSLLLLSACATKPVDIVIPPGVVKPITLDPRVFELCDKLTQIPVGATFDDVLAVTISNYELYASCANKQKVSVELLKQLSNKDKESK